MTETTTIRRSYRDFSHIWVETTHNRYAFAPLTADRIRGGTKADCEGCYAYVGETKMSNYVSEQSLAEVPDTVLEAAKEYGTIVTNVDGGWASWDGRPEFSTSYVDISDMEIVE
jgi:uncharacterized Fe-S cluster-containing radical SAM superfamily protein